MGIAALKEDSAVRLRDVLGLAGSFLNDAGWARFNVDGGNRYTGAFLTLKLPNPVFLDRAWKSAVAADSIILSFNRRVFSIRSPTGYLDQDVFRTVTVITKPAIGTVACGAGAGLEYEERDVRVQDGGILTARFDTSAPDSSCTVEITDFRRVENWPSAGRIANGI